jgi:hypothetical protein
LPFFAAASAIAVFRFARRFSSFRLRLRRSSRSLSRTGWFSFRGDGAEISLHTIAKTGAFVNNLSDFSLDL